MVDQYNSTARITTSKSIDIVCLLFRFCGLSSEYIIPQQRTHTTHTLQSSSHVSVYLNMIQFCPHTLNIYQDRCRYFPGNMTLSTSESVNWLSITILILQWHHLTEHATYNGRVLVTSNDNDYMYQRGLHISIFCRVYGAFCWTGVFL